MNRIHGGVRATDRRPGAAPPKRAILTLLMVAGAVAGGARIVEAQQTINASTVTGPNVLVILVDALRADHLGCYGYARVTSPTIDALAAEGVRYTRTYSQASWTKPSISSLFTGLYSSQHRVFTGSTQDRADRITSDVLGDQHTTLAEAFQAAGYATGAFIENAQISSFTGFDQGFDVYAEELGDADRITDAVVDWLDGQSGAPFLAYVHYLDPHWPYAPPSPYDTMFPAPAAGSIAFNDVNWKYLSRQIDAGEVVPTTADLDQMRALYDGEIRYTDAAIARLLAALRERKLLDETLILLTADHGEEFMEHGRVGHGNTLHEEVLHVPLIIRSPGGRPRVVDRIAELVDIMPTLLDLARLPIPEGLAGTSLRPFSVEVTGAGEPSDVAYAEHRPEGGSGRMQQAILDGRYKLIRTLMGNAEEAVTRGDDWTPPRIEPGDWLEFEVVMTEPGRFVALEIEPLEPQDHLRMVGRIEEIGPLPGSLRVLGIPCRLLPDVKFKDSDGKSVDRLPLTTGSWVKLRGSLNAAGTFEIQRVKQPDPKRRRKEEIKAQVEAVRLDSDSMVIEAAGVRIEVDDDTDFEGDWGARLEPAKDAGPPRRAAPAGSGANPAEQRTLLTVELFDGLADPGELDDVADRHPELAGKLLAMLDAWEERLVEHATGESEPVPLDQEMIEKLRSLGYVK